MAKVNSVFTDYNGTFDPKYLEIPLGYALKDFYKKIGNEEKYLELRTKQFELWKTFLSKGSDAVLNDFVDIVLVGEEQDNFEGAMKTVSSGKTDYISFWVRAIGSLHKKTGRKVFGDIDPKAPKLFRKAKESGLTTGVYSRSTTEIIRSYIEGIGMGDCFDIIKANDLIYEDSRIIEFDEMIKKGKPDFSDHIYEMGFDIEKTAFIDDKDITPLIQAGVGITAPTAKQDFKDECKEKGIYTPDSWEEIGGILEI